MSLIEQLKHFDVSLRFELHVPKQSRLAKTAHLIEGLVDTLPSAPLHIPQELIDESLSAFKTRRTTMLSNRHLRVFCVAGLNTLSQLEDASNYIKLLINELKLRAKSTLYRALLTGYLQIADIDAAWVKSIRQCLSEHINQLPRKWIRRCNEYGLLDDIPCQKLSNLFWDDTLVFDEQLHQAGITGALRTTGIGKQLLHTLCHELSNSNWLLEPQAEQQLERFLRFISINDELSFNGPVSQASIAQALLAPCLDNKPEANIQKKIERFLLSAYSDPRVNPGKWAHVPDELIQILNRWLTKQAMGLLLEVLNRTADAHHWESRNEFWGFYLDNDYVEEAWVVFGPEPSRHAHDLVMSNTDFSAGTYGGFKRGGGQLQANHSVLLMRIDNVVIAEWTHNGRVRLWDRSSATTPPFYRQSYFADVLRGTGIKHEPQAEFTHDAPGRWKEKVDKFIHERTGIKHGNISQRPKAKPQNSGGYPKTKAQIRRVATVAASKITDPLQDIPVLGKQTMSGAYAGLPATAKCKGCGKTKPAQEFHISRRRAGQLTFFCKQCARENPLMRSKNN